MTLRSLAIGILGALGGGVLGLMAWLAYQSGDNLEAAGWLTAGFLSLREVVSKLENVALGLHNGPTEGNDDV